MYNKKNNYLKMKIKGLLFIFIVLIFSVLATASTYSIVTKTSLFHYDEMQTQRLNSKLANIEDDILGKNENTKVLNCDVLVVGAGVSGVAATMQSGRLGVDTCLIEETSWVGGMLSSAGVSAIDGREEIASGIFKEFIERTKDYYSNKGKLSETKKCVVSYFCFEPSVAKYILAKMLTETPNLRIYINSKVDKVYKDDNKIVGVHFKRDGVEYIVKAKVTIDATEYGDIMYLADVPYSLGIDVDSQEKHSKYIEDCIQPLTYVAILQKTPEGQEVQKIEKPDNYDRKNFACTVENELCPASNSQFDLTRLQKYGALPNNKLMINIPSHSYGNDFDASNEKFDLNKRDEVLEMAKNYTLQYVYFMQNELELNYNLINEFSTDDYLAKMPYIRESRRLDGVYRLIEDDIWAQTSNRVNFFKNSIAIGDYPIDLHYCSTGRGDLFIPVNPYQIPYEVLVPKDVDGFLVAEKNISVSHIVNGTTRLQPIVMSIGQASGAAAAISVIDNVDPRDINISKLQETLLNSGSKIIYFKDLDETHYAYPYVSQLALKGMIKGFSDYSFKPETNILKEDFVNVLIKVMSEINPKTNWNDIVRGELGSVNSIYLSREKAASLIANIILKDIKTDINMFYFNDVKEGSSYFREIQILAKLNIISNINPKFRPHDNITRAEAITMIVRAIGK